MTGRGVGEVWSAIRSVRGALASVGATSVILLSSALPSTAQPAWTGIVTDAPPGLQAGSSPMRVEGDAAGNAFHVWRQTNSSTYITAIRVARFSAASKAWEWDTATELSPDGSDPAAAMNPSGDAVAVWTERETSSSWRVRASRYVSGSASWGAPVTVATAGSVSMPRVALDAAGNAVVTWWQRNGTMAQARAARFAAAAGTWTTPVAIATFGNEISIVSPALVVDPSGNATAVWVPSLAGARTHFFVQVSRWPSAAAAWSAPETLASVPVIPGNSMATAFTGEIANDAAGNLLAMWTELYGNGTTYAVKWARYSDAGGTWSAPQTFSTQDRSGPSLVIDAEGHATAVWVRQVGSSSTVYSSRLPAQGSSWSAPSVVSTAATSMQVGQLAVDGAGVVTAVWSQGGTVSPVTRGRVRAARSVGGASWTAPVTLLDVPSVNLALASAAAAAHSGEVVVLFRDFRSTRWSTTGAEGLSAPLDLEMLTYFDYTGVAFSGNPLVVRWAPPQTGLPVAGYRIEAGSTGTTDVAVVDVGATTRVDATVPAVPRLVVRVRAMSGAAVGPPSNPFYIHNILVCGALPGPGNLTASVSAGVVTLRWSSIAYAYYFQLEAGSGPGLADLATINVGQATRFTTAAPPGTYYVRVRGVDDCAPGRPSNEVVVTVPGATLPGAPVLNPPVVNGTTVALTWAPGAGGAATRYTLAASTTPGGAPIVTAPFTTTGATFTNVPPGTYYVWLTATNAAGTSPPSAVVTVVVGSVTAGVP